MNDDDFDFDLDLGLGHTLAFIGWRPDRELNPHYADVPDLAQGEHHGAIVRHDKTDMPHGFCEGAITFDTATTRALRDHHGAASPLWQVQSWNPLTISPSLLCHCGDHGFIREGRWVSA